MLKLYQFKSAWGLPNVSPFCMKLETYLRMADIPFSIVNNANPMQSPKGKFPFIEDKGKIMSDSGFIIDYLKAEYGDQLDKHLSDEQKAVSHALRRMTEENLYWAVVYFRWFIPENWKKTRKAYFGDLPPVIRSVLPGFAKKQVQKQLRGHGMGRHSEDEILQLGKADLQAISDILGTKPFINGEAPASIDAIIYAFLANIINVPLESPLKDEALKLPNLQPYCTRMKEKYYG